MDRHPHLSKRLTAILTVLVAGPLLAMSAPRLMSAPATVAVVVWIMVAILLIGIAWLFSAFVTNWLLAPLSEAVDALTDASDGDQWLNRMSWRPDEVVTLVRQARAEAASIRRQGRSSMVALASFLHDVKAPLAGSKHIIDTVSLDLQGEQRTLIDRARQELWQVQTMVHDALSFSRLGTEQLDPCWTLIDVQDVAWAVVERIEWALDSSSCRVTVEGEWSTHTDPTLLGRCLENLLLNAMRGARASVAVEVRPGAVVITDDGPGLPRRLADMLAAAQASNDMPVLPTSGGSGHGIGLVATVMLVTLIGGRLVLQSTSPAGTTLIVYLPDRQPSVTHAKVGTAQPGAT